VLTNGFSASENRFGALAGVGFEFGFTRQWSAKAEVNYIWFGEDDEVTASDGTRLKIGADIVQAKVGVNYRFDQPFLPY
jgi:opacity protein-like surface antigen